MDEYKSLLNKLVNNKLISEQYLIIYDNEKDNLQISEKSDTKITIGLLYYIYFFNLLDSKTSQRINTSAEIKNIVNKFDNNELKAEEAKIKLDTLVTLNQKLNVLIPVLEDLDNNMLFSSKRTSVDINKLVTFLAKFTEFDFTTILDIFLTHQAEFEKNSNYFEKIIQENRENESITKFITNLLSKIKNRKILFDIDDINDVNFNKKLLNILELFFESFKEQSMNNIDFGLKIPETLADKNNKNYFFKANEKAIITENIQNTPSMVTNTDIKQPETYISLAEGNPWDLVGAIVIDPVNKGLGIASFPFIHDNKIFISTLIEKEATLDVVEKLYHSISSMRISDVSDNTMARKNLISSEISEALNIPVELSLCPTIIYEFLNTVSVTIDNLDLDLDIRRSVLRTEYYPYDMVIYNKEDHVVVIPDDIEVLTTLGNSESYISPSLGINLTNKPISLSREETDIGRILTENNFLAKGKYLFIALDFPNKIIIEKLLIKRIRSKNNQNENELWKLRFTISKSIDVFEGEALLPTNIWKYIWTEKILINPYEVLESFIGFVPSGAIKLKSLGKDSIKLARGVDIGNVNSYFDRMLYTIKSEKKLTLGQSIGLKLDSNNNIKLVYCALTVSDILRKLERDDSFQSQEKLSKRISKAFMTKLENNKLLHLNNVLTYMLFYAVQFNYFIDFTDLDTLITWLETEFEFKFINIDKIKNIDYTNNEIIIEV